MDEQMLEETLEALRKSRFKSDEWWRLQEQLEKHFKPTEEEIRLRKDD